MKYLSWFDLYSLDVVILHTCQNKQLGDHLIHSMLVNSNNISLEVLKHIIPH